MHQTVVSILYILTPVERPCFILIIVISRHQWKQVMEGITLMMENLKKNGTSLMGTHLIHGHMPNTHKLYLK